MSDAGRGGVSPPGIQGARHRLWLGGVLALALGVRLWFQQAVVFPGLDDPAFYVLVARALVSGRGFVVDALWSYYVAFASVTHPSNEFWMPLPSVLMAVPLALFGEHVWAAQIPGIIAGLVATGVTYLVGRQVFGAERPFWPLVGAALMACNTGNVNQSVSMDSAAIYTALASSTLWVALGASPNVRRWGVAGVLGGLAYLARSSDALVLLVAIVGVAWMRGTRDKAAYGALGVAFVLVIAPWLVRNTLVFGTPSSPMQLRTIWITTYEQMFNYAHLAGPEDWAALGVGGVALTRWQALTANTRFYLLVTFPWGVLAVPGLWWARRWAPLAVALVYVPTAFLVSALVFSMHSASGAYFHAVGALVPYQIVAALWVVDAALARVRRPLYGPLVAGALVVLSAFQLNVAHSEAQAVHARYQQWYATADTWLKAHVPPGTVLMTPIPYSLVYATGYPAIPLPFAEPPQAALQAAKRYDARYLVLIGQHGLYPEALATHPPGFTLVYAWSEGEIYALDPAGAGAR